MWNTILCNVFLRNMRIAKASDPETSLGRRATHASLCPCKQSNRYLRLQQTDRSLQYVISNRPDTDSLNHMSDRHQSTFVCNISQFVVHSLVCEQTSINNAKPRSADIRQHLLAAQSQFLHLSKSGKHHGYDATCAFFSQICQPHAV